MNMQDPSSGMNMNMNMNMSMMKVQFPEQEQVKCPRCESSNTKFCYYNNYNLSQPRHFCKSCRRYWTKGGTLRNIPVGGGTRKNAKRPKRQNPDPQPPIPPPNMAAGSFSSLLATPDSGLNLEDQSNDGYLLHNAESGFWGGGENGWPDLAIHTPQAALPH